MIVESASTEYHRRCFYTTMQLVLSPNETSPAGNSKPAMAKQCSDPENHISQDHDFLNPLNSIMDFFAKSDSVFESGVGAG